MSTNGTIDAVLSYHMNPLVCGVSKFNHALARRLGVGCLPLGTHTLRPLVSVKWSELTECDISAMCQWQQYQEFDLFSHDVPCDRAMPLVTCAEIVYAANDAVAYAVEPYAAKVVKAFCPSTVEGNPTRGKYRVLAFGMAHKLVLPHFEELKRELDRDHPDYTIELSTAVHEGNPWDEALTESTEAMRGIFGDRLRVLGFLADDALARVLTEVDAVAAFYVPALRANNTTAWAALSAGKFLYTNLDQQSPELNPEKYSWDALLKVLA